MIYLSSLLCYAVEGIQKISWIFCPGMLQPLTDRCLFYLSEKQQEFYKNAKQVKKYKRLLKQQGLKHDTSSSINPLEVWYDIFFIWRLRLFYMFLVESSLRPGKSAKNWKLFVDDHVISAISLAVYYKTLVLFLISFQILRFRPQFQFLNYQFIVLWLFENADLIGKMVVGFKRLICKPSFSAPALLAGKRKASI